MQAQVREHAMRGAIALQGADSFKGIMEYLEARYAELCGNFHKIREAEALRIMQGRASELSDLLLMLRPQTALIELSAMDDQKKKNPGPGMV